MKTFGLWMVGGLMSGLALHSALTMLDPAGAQMGVWAWLAALGGASVLLVVVNLPARARAAVVVEAAEVDRPRKRY